MPDNAAPLAVEVTRIRVTFPRCLSRLAGGDSSHEATAHEREDVQDGPGPETPEGEDKEDTQDEPAEELFDDLEEGGVGEGGEKEAVFPRRLPTPPPTTRMPQVGWQGYRPPVRQFPVPAPVPAPAVPGPKPPGYLGQLMGLQSGQKFGDRPVRSLVSLATTPVFDPALRKVSPRAADAAKAVVRAQIPLSLVGGGVAGYKGVQRDVGRTAEEVARTTGVQDVDQLKGVRERAGEEAPGILRRTFLPSWLGGDPTVVGDVHRDVARETALDYARNDMHHLTTNGPGFVPGPVRKLTGHAFDVVRSTTPAGAGITALLHGLASPKPPDVQGATLRSLQRHADRLQEDPQQLTQSPLMRSYARVAGPVLEAPNTPRNVGWKALDYLTSGRWADVLMRLLGWRAGVAGKPTWVRDTTYHAGHAEGARAVDSLRRKSPLAGAAAGLAADKVRPWDLTNQAHDQVGRPPVNLLKGLQKGVEAGKLTPATESQVRTLGDVFKNLPDSAAGLDKDSSLHHTPAVSVKDRQGDHLVCPHCGKKLSETGVYTDRKGWHFCRACLRRGKGSITIPASLGEDAPKKASLLLDYLIPPDPEEFDLDLPEKEAQFRPLPRQRRQNLAGLATSTGQENPPEETLPPPPEGLPAEAAAPLAGAIGGTLLSPGKRLKGALRGLLVGTGAGAGSYLASRLTGGDLGSRVGGGAAGGALAYLLSRAAEDQ